jgi:hypothetical protein
MIQSLIDKQDTSEQIRDQIAAILAAEVANQMALATTAGKDPQDWKLRIFTERSNPWEQFLNGQADESPLVNVWYDSSFFDESKSNTVSEQMSETVYNIDIYGYGVSSDDGEGHKAGDKEAALECQRAIRLVRNIIMASENTYLQARGLVWQRWPQSINSFQPQQGENSVEKIVAARFALRVRFTEFAPQYAGQPLELLTTTVKRAEDGSVYFTADYDYT